MIKVILENKKRKVEPNDNSSPTGTVVTPRGRRSFPARQQLINLFVSVKT